MRAGTAFIGDMPDMWSRVDGAFSHALPENPTFLYAKAGWKEKSFHFIFQIKKKCMLHKYIENGDEMKW